ncbi:hypothetical protein TWF730_004094 [Orbilia blumenaviensis]
MLTHLSAKFHMGNPEDQGTHEPRVALILNRFTRTLTVLYASHASSSIFGITPNQLTGKSFFECIHEDCLQEAVDALERAKENDSIAYLRFRWRDPINNAVAERTRTQGAAPADPPLRRSRRIGSQAKRKLESDEQDDTSGSSGRASKRRAVGAQGEGLLASGGEASTSRLPAAAEDPAETAIGNGARAGGATASAPTPAPREVEAVVSCTSDGLVVILRQARPLIPKPLHNVPSGIFASPWAPVSLVPRVEILPDKNREASFMEAIQEVAVFAWSLRQLGGEIISNTSTTDGQGRDTKTEHNDNTNNGSNSGSSGSSGGSGSGGISKSNSNSNRSSSSSSGSSGRDSSSKVEGFGSSDGTSEESPVPSEPKAQGIPQLRKNTVAGPEFETANNDDNRDTDPYRGPRAHLRNDHRARKPSRR